MMFKRENRMLLEGILTFYGRVFELVLDLDRHHIWCCGFFRRGTSSFSAALSVISITFILKRFRSITFFARTVVNTVHKLICVGHLLLIHLRRASKSHVGKTSGTVILALVQDRAISTFNMQE